MQIGADEFLTKPVIPERPVTAISIQKQNFPPRSVLDDAAGAGTGLVNRIRHERTAQHQAFAHPARRYVLSLALLDLKRF